MAPPALLPIQILAGVALVAVVVAFVYVLRHLKKIEQLIVADNLIPAQRGPRNNLVLIVCASADRAGDVVALPAFQGVSDREAIAVIGRCGRLRLFG